MAQRPERAIFRRLVLLFLCGLQLGSTFGCQFAPKPHSIHWPWSKNEKPKPIPDRILPVWTDSVLHQPNQPGVRGFGGRVYFYAGENTDPVEVDGSLAVYVFDADDLTPTQQKPLRKYVYTPDQFESHMSKTSIGPSYSVWLPWGEVGGEPRRLSLIARFEGRDGGTTISDPTIKMLPGVPMAKENAQDKNQSTVSRSNTVQLAGHEDSDSTPVESIQGESKNDIETIDLPPDFMQHLRGPSAGMENRNRFDIKSTQRSTSVNVTADESLQLPNDKKLLDSEKQAESESVPTTQVFDYRTRRSAHSGMFPSKPTKTDIREGRWIKSISR